ncbi:MAG: hypothetical protein AAB784_03215 [Patescibacteria group bacterium]
MALVMDGFLILVGFVLGYFFQVPVLLGFTILCVIIVIYMAMTFREMETLITLAFISCAVIANAVMWVTYYFSTEQSWLQTFIKTYILR